MRFIYININTLLPHSQIFSTMRNQQQLEVSQNKKCICIFCPAVNQPDEFSSRRSPDAGRFKEVNEGWVQYSENLQDGEWQYVG